MIPVIVIAEKKNSQQGRIVPRKNNVIMFEVYSTVAYHARVFRRVVFPFNSYYSKEPKSVTAFDLFTFFRADLIQSIQLETFLDI